jgi:hypothetical protein
MVTTRNANTFASAVFAHLQTLKNRNTYGTFTLYLYNTHYSVVFAQPTAGFVEDIMASFMEQLYSNGDFVLTYHDGEVKVSMLFSDFYTLEQIEIALVKKFIQQKYEELYAPDLEESFE